MEYIDTPVREWKWEKSTNGQNWNALSHNENLMTLPSVSSNAYYRVTMTNQAGARLQQTFRVEVSEIDPFIAYGDDKTIAGRPWPCHATQPCLCTPRRTPCSPSQPTPHAFTSGYSTKTPYKPTHWLSTWTIWAEKWPIWTILCVSECWTPAWYTLMFHRCFTNRLESRNRIAFQPAGIWDQYARTASQRQFLY